MPYHRLSRNKTKLYNVWKGMRQRCSNKNHASYCNYGGRGINVCKEWQSFINFYNWAISNGYTETCGLQIDRINNSKGYSPSNCRLVNLVQQARNKRNNIYVILFGEKVSLKAIVERYKLAYSCVLARYYKGWPPEKLIVPSGTYCSGDFIEPKMNEEKARKAKELLSLGWSSYAIAKEFGINPCYILRIKHGKTWVSA